MFTPEVKATPTSGVVENERKVYVIFVHVGECVRGASG